jgi:hypothetical protein
MIRSAAWAGGLRADSLGQRERGTPDGSTPSPARGSDASIAGYQHVSGFSGTLTVNDRLGEIVHAGRAAVAADGQPRAQHGLPKTDLTGSVSANDGRIDGLDHVPPRGAWNQRGHAEAPAAGARGTVHSVAYVCL